MLQKLTIVDKWEQLKLFLQKDTKDKTKLIVRDLILLKLETILK